MFDGSVPWDEAIAITKELMAEPTSHTQAALAGWDYPISRESLVLADLVDLYMQSHADPKKPRPKRYGRPFEAGGTDRQKSAQPTVSQEVIRAALAARGH